MSNILLYVLIAILFFCCAVLSGAISFLRKVTEIQDERLNAHEETMSKLSNDLIVTKKILLNHVIILDQRIKELSNEDKCEG